MLNSDICFVGIRMSLQDKEINRSVDSGSTLCYLLLAGVDGVCALANLRGGSGFPESAQIDLV